MQASLLIDLQLPASAFSFYKSYLRLPSHVFDQSVASHIFVFLFWFSMCVLSIFDTCYPGSLCIRFARNTSSLRWFQIKKSVCYDHMNKSDWRTVAWCQIESGKLREISWPISTNVVTDLFQPHSDVFVFSWTLQTLRMSGVHNAM